MFRSGRLVCVALLFALGRLEAVEWTATSGATVIQASIEWYLVSPGVASYMAHVDGNYGGAGGFGIKLSSNGNAVIASGGPDPQTYVWRQGPGAATVNGTINIGTATVLNARVQIYGTSPANIGDTQSINVADLTAEVNCNEMGVTMMEFPVPRFPVAVNYRIVVDRVPVTGAPDQVSFDFAVPAGGSGNWVQPLPSYMDDGAGGCVEVFYEVTEVHVLDAALDDYREIVDWFDYEDPPTFTPEPGIYDSESVGEWEPGRSSSGSGGPGVTTNVDDELAAVRAEASTNQLAEEMEVLWKAGQELDEVRHNELVAAVKGIAGGSELGEELGVISGQLGGIGTELGAIGDSLEGVNASAQAEIDAREGLPSIGDMEAAGAAAASAESGAFPVVAAPSLGFTATAPSFIIENGLVGTIDWNPFRADRFGPMATWIRGFLAWLVIIYFGIWASSESRAMLIGMNTVRQARGNTVGGSGAQGTAMLAAAAITAIIYTGLVAMLSWLTGDIGFGALLGAVGSNPLAGLPAQIAYCLDQIIPMATVCGALVSRIVWSVSAQATLAGVAAAIRFVVP